MKFTDFLGKKLLIESGYSRVRRILFGDVPSIKTVGIVTAQNPNGSPPHADNPIENARENERLNNELKQYLRMMNFGPIKVKGHFGVKEDSFLVPNITREELIKIGEWSEQISVIWGEKLFDKNDNPYFRFEYIDVASKKTEDERTVHLGGEYDIDGVNHSVQDRKDYYTMVGGKKFIIPFFSDPLGKKVHGSKYGSVEDKEEEYLDKLKKAESFFIPFFDDLSSELFFEDSSEITYYSDKLSKDPITQKLIEEITYHSQCLCEEDKIGKYYYHHRGIINNCMKKLG
jgi:hypothetical protein